MPTSVVARPSQQRESSTWTFVTIFIACLLIGLLLSRSHIFVVISSDRSGQALIPVLTMSPGETASGQVTLSNDGLLPFSYSLEVKNPNGGPLTKGLAMEVKSTRDGGLLYNGPLVTSTSSLGHLQPGQKLRLQVSVSLPKTFPAGVAINLTFIWTARAEILEAWPWLAVIGLVVIDAVLVSLFLKEARRLRRRVQSPAAQVSTARR
jgi:hypothetical protein